jgi:hypothetical protein
VIVRSTVPFRYQARGHAEVNASRLRRRPDVAAASAAVLAEQLAAARDAEWFGGATSKCEISGPFP